MAVEKVLNQYCSDSDPSRPALKKLLEDLLDWFMLSERQIYLLKNENDKATAFMIENLVHLWVTWKSLSKNSHCDFRPHILPEPYKRVDESYTDLLMSLVINGYQNLPS